MTGQPLNPQNTDPETTELLDVKPKNTLFSGLTGKFKPSKVAKLGKPLMPKPTLDKTAATKVPLSRPTKRLPKEPGQAPREVKPGLALATTAQQRKLIPMVGVFLLLGAISLYVNFGNTSTAKPVTAFVGPGPGQPGYIPAPGTMNTGTTTGTLNPTTPGSASAGFMPARTTPGMATTPAMTTTGAGTGVAVNTTPPPVTVAGTTTAPGSTTSASAGPAGQASATSKGNKASAGGATTQTVKSASSKPGTITAGIPGAPGSKPAPSPTDVPTEPVIPNVFSAADGGKGGAGNAGSTGGSSTGNAAGNGNVRVAPGMNAAQPASLRNVPIAAVSGQVPIAQAAPLSIQSLPAPVPTPVRATPPLSAVPVPVALPTPVRVQTIPQAAQSMPLPAPVTAQAPSGVTLTKGGVPVPTAPAAPPVTLVGTAIGDTPTAILATPDGQIIAGIGDHVTVNNLDYTVSKIYSTQITLSHLKETLTLTETN